MFLRTKGKMLQEDKPTPLKNIMASCYINTALQLLSQLSRNICTDDSFETGNILHHILYVFKSFDGDSSLVSHLVSIQKYIQAYRKFDKNLLDSPHTCILALFTDPAVLSHIEPLLQIDYVEHIRYTDAIFSTFYMTHPDKSTTPLTNFQQQQMENFIDNPMSNLMVDSIGHVKTKSHIDIETDASIHFVAPKIVYSDIKHLLKHKEKTNVTPDIMMNIYSMEMLLSKSYNIGFVAGKNTFKRKIRYAETDWVPKNRFFIVNSFVRDKTFKPPLIFKNGNLIGLGLYGYKHWIACLLRNNKWWKCDDENITLIETDDIIEHIHLKMTSFTIFYALYIIKQK